MFITGHTVLPLNVGFWTIRKYHDNHRHETGSPRHAQVDDRDAPFRQRRSLQTTTFSSDNDVPFTQRRSLQTVLGTVSSG